MQRRGRGPQLPCRGAEAAASVFALFFFFGFYTRRSDANATRRGTVHGVHDKRKGSNEKEGTIERDARRSAFVRTRLKRRGNVTRKIVLIMARRHRVRPHKSPL